MIILSKYKGVCTKCSREVLVGDRIHWDRAQKGVRHVLCSEEGQTLARKLEKSSATDADIDIPCPPGLAYLPYQRAGIAYMLEHRNAFVGDEMGLGKTVQAIGLMNAMPDAQKVIVVCPASVKRNWQIECKKWLVRNWSVEIYPRSGNVTILNPEQLPKIINQDLAHDLLILDECHYFKNPKSARTKHVQKLAKQAKKIVCLSGTPFLNRPLELWPLLQILDPATWDPAGIKKQELVGPGEGTGFFAYARRYCGAKEVYIGRKKHWDFQGNSNLLELQEKLRASCMVRRLKADVLSELPPKRRQTIVLGRNEKSTELSEDEEMVRAVFDEGVSNLEALKRKVPFEDISRVRKLLALYKVDDVLTHVIGSLESSEKIVVFAHHQEIVEKLLEGLAEYSPVSITGATPIPERQVAVETFQKNPECRVIVGTIGAMGVGLTLTASSHVIFAELDWSPAALSQAEDRCHRIGAKNAVLIQHLVIEGSLDSRILELVLAKQVIADLALDVDTLEDVQTDRALIESKGNGNGVPTPPPEEVEKALNQLRYLAERCDGAQKEDGCGFNKFDASLGKELASKKTLSAKQLAFASRILIKYRRQLEGVA